MNRMLWDKSSTLKQIEKQIIREALVYFSGNKTHTAKALGISIRSMRNLIKEYRLYEFFHEKTKITYLE